jgi:toxin YoeB
MKEVRFSKDAFAQFNEWYLVDPKVFKTIFTLIKIIQRTPYEGKGNPEPLKHQYSGFWSRRINSEHRLIYKCTDQEDVIIVSCKGHYG